MRDERGRWVIGHSAYPETRFKKGLTPHNKGKRMAEYVSPESMERIKRAQFKKGQTPLTAHPKGKVVRWYRVKNGRPEISYVINIDWKGNRKPHNNYRWYLWEVENQQDRPKGMVIAVKNGNPEDIRIENLEVITRAENLERNRL